jgi:hypothetical protein
MFVVLCVTSFRVNAEDRFVDVPQCPKFLTVQQKITSINDAWVPVGSDRQWALSGVGFSVGNPEYPPLFLLMPREERSLSKNSSVAFFDNLRPAKDDEDAWISCYYHTNTDAILTRKLPKNVMRCEVAYTMRPLREVVVRCFETPRQQGKASR